MLAFKAQRLVSGECDKLGVFLTENRQMVLEIHAVGIEDELLIVRSDIVENGHLLVTHYHQPLLLERVQPRDIDMQILIWKN